MEAAPALIVGQVPVEDVELGGRHAVNLPLDGVQRHKVARGVEQQPAPREARRIVDRNVRNGGILRAVLDQLEQGFHPAQRAEAGIRPEGNALGGHLQLVAFIAVRARNGRDLFGNHHVNRRRFRRRQLRLQRPAGLTGDALAPAAGGIPKSSPVTFSVS